MSESTKQIVRNPNSIPWWVKSIILLSITGVICYKLISNSRRKAFLSGYSYYRPRKLLYRVAGICQQYYQTEQNLDV